MLIKFVLSQRVLLSLSGPVPSRRYGNHLGVNFRCDAITSVIGRDRLDRGKSSLAEHSAVILFVMQQL